VGERRGKKTKSMKIRVTIVQFSGEPRSEITLALSGEQLYNTLVLPYEEGRPVVIGGRTFRPEEVERITISAARSPARWRPHARGKTGTDAKQADQRS